TTRRPGERTGDGRGISGQSEDGQIGVSRLDYRGQRHAEPGRNGDEAMMFDPLALTRRHFFQRTAAGIGIPALASLLMAENGPLPGLPHFPPKAKRVIYLHQSGAPSQLDLFDYKPGLTKLQGTELPGSVRMGQRITGMT